MRDEPILFAKITPPELPSPWLSRPRLLEALARSTTITKLHSLIGIGKTLLLADYARSSDQPVAWLSLDAKDNLPGRLLRYLVASLRQSGLALEEGCDSGEGIPLDQWEYAYNLLSNRLQFCKREQVIVLDNLEQIRSPQVAGIVQKLLQVPNPKLRWFILTRGDSLVNFGRFRACDQLTELGFYDLMFTAGELEELCSQNRLELPADEVFQLHSRTHGWPSGVLLWLSAYRRISSTTITHIDSSQVVDLAYKFLAQYISEEAVSLLTREEQRFLRKTIVADKLTIELANFLYDGARAEIILPRLVRAGLFITGSQGYHRYYRLPGLFNDVLYQYWRRKSYKTLVSLHLRATDWYLEARAVNDAIYQAIRAGNIDLSLQIMQRYPQELYSSGLAGWAEQQTLDAFFKRDLRNNVSLAGLNAATAVSVDDVVRSKESLKQIRRHVRGVDKSSTRLRLEALVVMLRCQLAHTGGNCRHCLNLAAAAPIQGRNLGKTASAIKFIGARSAFSLGLLVQSEREAWQALEDFRQWPNTGYRNKISLLLVQIYLAGGRLPEAMLLAQDSMDLRDDASRKRDPFRNQRDLALALTYWESNKLDEAQKYFEQAMNSAIELDHQITQAHCFYYLGSYLYTRREDEKVIDLCDQGRRIAEANHQYLLVRLIDTLRTRVALRQDDAETVDHWLTCWDHYIKRYGTNTLLEEKSLYAWIQAARASSSEARRVSTNLIQQSSRESHTALLIDMHLLQAHLSHTSNDTVESYSALNRAVSAARDSGLIRAFCEADAGLVDRLKLGIAKKSRDLVAISSDNVAFVEKILLPAMVPLITPEHINQLSPVAALTKRELNVLDLMAQDRSNQEIAENLYIGISTVKTHVSNILAKLNVENRREAIKKTRSIGGE